RHKEKEEKSKPSEIVGPITIFRYADGLDITLMVFGTIAPVLNRVCLPLMSLVFGEMHDGFVSGCISQERLCKETVHIFYLFCFCSCSSPLTHLFPCDRLSFPVKRRAKSKSNLSVFLFVYFYSCSRAWL
ncbi:hypothetical protein KIL84_011343, partial [Mauremys mutica]